MTPSNDHITINGVQYIRADIHSRLKDKLLTRIAEALERIADNLEPDPIEPPEAGSESYL